MSFVNSNYSMQNRIIKSKLSQIKTFSVHLLKVKNN